MQTYLIRFNNAFETKWFFDNQEGLFIDHAPELITHTSKFIEFTLKNRHYFASSYLLSKFPSIQITKKITSKGKSKYIKL